MIPFPFLQDWIRNKNLNDFGSVTGEIADFQDLLIVLQMGFLTDLVPNKFAVGNLQAAYVCLSPNLRLRILAGRAVGENVYHVQAMFDIYTSQEARIANLKPVDSILEDVVWDGSKNLDYVWACLYAAIKAKYSDAVDV